MSKVNVIPLASDLRDKGTIAERLSYYRSQLNEMDGFTFSFMSPDGQRLESELTLVLVLSGGTESKALEFLARSDDPALLLCHHADNALAASLEIQAMLRASGKAGYIVQTLPGWQHELREISRLFAASSAMKQSRIGVIGARGVEVLEPWRLTEQVNRTWGASLIRIGMQELVAAVEGADLKEARDAALEFEEKANSVVEPNSETLLGAAKIYVGLKNLVASYQLDAVTVRCFDLLGLVHNTGCYALARLNEEGIASACEADVLSCVGMLFLQKLSGYASFMANPSVIDRRRGRVTLAHCTIPRTLTSSYEIRSHFESGIGAAIHGNVPTGAATVFRIGGPDLSEIMAAKANVVECGNREDMCRTQLILESADPGVADTLLARPLGNHHLVIPGDWERPIKQFASMFLGNPGL